VLDAAGRPVVVDARLAMSGEPATVRWPAPPEEDPPRSRAAAAPHGTAAPGPGSTRAVVDWAGPWPLAERWWTPAPRRRVHVQVLLDDGRGLLVASARGRWAVEGLYDRTPVRRAPRALRVQLPRRRVPPRGARRRGRAARALGARGHRPRRPVRRRALRGGRAQGPPAHDLRVRAAPARAHRARRPRARPAHRRPRPALDPPARARARPPGVPQPLARDRDRAPRDRDQGRRRLPPRAARGGGRRAVARAHRVPQGRG